MFLTKHKILHFGKLEVFLLQMKMSSKSQFDMLYFIFYGKRVF